MENFNNYFKGKVILITGSNSGIGEATALEFASLGANVVITGRSHAKVKSAAENCRKKFPNSKVLEIVADLMNDDDVKRIIDTTVKEYEKIDVLVNNAGIFGSSNIFDSDSLKEYDRMMNNNVRSIVRLTHYAVPYLKNTKGAIVNVSSVASIKAHRDTFVYCMSKSAIDMFTQCLAIDLGHLGIRVNAVNPSVILTPIFERSLGWGNDEMEALKSECVRNYPLKRHGEPKEVADAIVYLASDRASFVSGVLLGVDGGSLWTSSGCTAQYD